MSVCICVYLSVCLYAGLVACLFGYLFVLLCVLCSLAFVEFPHVLACMFVCMFSAVQSGSVPSTAVSIVHYCAKLHRAASCRLALFDTVQLC